MSRSYKKTPMIKKTSKKAKQSANRHCRRGRHNHKGSMVSSSKCIYKKYVNSYDVVDMICEFDYNSYLKFYELPKNKSNYKCWFKIYKAK